jgi:hypothetical protein
VTDTLAPLDAVTFGLEYDGPALANHEMDVRDLARALLSTADLYRQLNREVNPNAPDVSVNVRATSEGSFLVELHLLFESVEQGLLSPPVLAAGSLIGLITASAGLISFVKRKLRNPEVLREPLPNGVIRVTFEDGTTMELPASLLRAYEQAAVRQDLSDLVQPLTRSGIDTVAITRDGSELVRVEQSDVPAFELSRSTDASSATTLGVSEREVYLTIRTAGFASGRWTFSDGASSFQAVLRDETFSSRVQRGEQFGALDVLRCRVREMQTRDATGLHTSIEVIDVIEHLPPAQGILFAPPGLDDLDQPASDPPPSLPS